MTLEELAVQMKEIEDRSIRNEGRIKKLEAGNDALQTLATKVAVMEVQLQQIRQSIDTLTQKVELMEAKPGKKWDSIVDKIAWALIAAALGFILAHIGIAA